MKMVKYNNKDISKTENQKDNGLPLLKMEIKLQQKNMQMDKKQENGFFGMTNR